MSPGETIAMAALWLAFFAVAAIIFNAIRQAFFGPPIGWRRAGVGLWERKDGHIQVFLMEDGPWTGKWTLHSSERYWLAELDGSSFDTHLDAIAAVENCLAQEGYERP